MLLEGQVALVTGAGRGLGRAHALALAAAGAAVVVNDLGSSGTGEGADVGPAAAVVAEIHAAGGRAVANTRSVSDWADAATIVEEAVDAFGELDVVVNNAGISRFATFGAMSEADWNISFDVNAKGTAAIIDAAARHWQSASAGRARAIINTASPAGPHPLPPIGIYSATKAAVIAITQVAAQELAPLGVRVNAIAPVARTRLIDAAPEMADLMPKDPVFDRFRPEHVSPLVVFLASRLCPFSGRLFGIEGDDVYLFTEPDARMHANNKRQQWTPELLAEALEGFPLQDRRHAIFPGAAIELPSPPDEVLAVLNQSRFEVKA